MPIIPDKGKCQHPEAYRVIIPSGCMQYEWGEVVDDTKDLEICGICGAVIEEEKEEIIY